MLPDSYCYTKKKNKKINESHKYQYIRKTIHFSFRNTLKKIPPGTGSTCKGLPQRRLHFDPCE
uniref:Uncharacterized protein n=1 Tax=Helianthus annuus TaxID=4232 RepID=A0A251U861_HELAN